MKENHQTSRRRVALFICAVAIAAASGGCEQRILAGQPLVRVPDVPYEPTPHDVVSEMLRLAQVGANDVVYDLGCGDGRIVIAAAQRFGARGVGVDIDANLINQAEANAKTAGVERRVKFLVQDAMTVDVSDATVVTLYLLSASNVKLRPILTRQLRRGARIVSHSFAMGDWEPEVVDTFRDANGTSRTLYLWTTDGKPRP